VIISERSDKNNLSIFPLERAYRRMANHDACPK